MELVALRQKSPPACTACKPICNGNACRVFSVEKGPEGKRSFIVTSSAKFWERYSDMLPQHRHFYEIIRERRPCHLYFGERLLIPFMTYPVTLQEDSIVRENLWT